jgi:hypothetical protein
MKLARPVSKKNKLQNISEKTEQAACKFMDFCELEKKLRSHTVPHPLLVRWAKNCQRVYFNAFVDGLVTDGIWQSTRLIRVYKEEDATLFSYAKQYTLKESKKTSTSAKADVQGFKLFTKSTDAIIAQ